MYFYLHTVHTTHNVHISSCLDLAHVNAVILFFMPAGSDRLSGNLTKQSMNGFCHCVFCIQQKGHEGN